MTIETPYINSGVEGGTGYEFQKNCLVYILLDEYERFRDKEYFVCMESADDFIICFIVDNNLKEIDTYQVKKKSDSKWTISHINKKDIIAKICEAGLIVQEDTSYTHTTDYCQKLHFLSNQIMELDSKLCNEENDTIKYEDLDKNTQVSIETYIKNYYNKESRGYNLDQLSEQRNHLIFKFIDLNRRVSEQRNCLITKIGLIFNGSVSDCKAALDTILSALTISSTTFNNNSQINLLQRDKQVTSDKINECFGVIQTKSIFKEKWKTEVKRVICDVLDLKIPEQLQFYNCCCNSFDLFKDLTQVEHQGILSMAEELSWQARNEENLANLILSKYNSSSSVTFSDLELKAIAYAAAIQVYNTINNG